MFGLPAGTYLIEFMVVKKEVTISDGYYPVIMYGNGWHPEGIAGQDFGYTAAVLGNKFIMCTKVTCVRYDMAGRALNIYRPVTSLGNLSWIYGLVKK